jgi:8-oxo-dGTP diphosphatase
MLFLAAQRKPGGPRGLLWEFPGGKVEPGESDEVALEREIREELDCVVRVGGRVAEAEHSYPDLSLTLVLYRCELLRGEPKLLDAHALAWETADRLTALPFCEADQPFLPKIAQES